MPPAIQKTDAQWRELLAAKGAEPLAFQITRHAAVSTVTGDHGRHRRGIVHIE